MTQSNGFDFFKRRSGTVTICGSTRFYEQCMELIRYLTFNNWVTLSCGSWGHSYHKDKPYDMERTVNIGMVKLLHLRKIAMSDAVVVCCDKSLYYGKSTEYEIEYAKHINVPVFVWDGDDKNFVSGYCQQMTNQALPGHLTIASFIAKHGNPPI